MKKIVCKPAPELELEFSGGETILLRFDVYSVSVLQETEGGLGKISMENIPEMAATIIYAAGKNNNENFTQEKARALVADMSVDTIKDIIQEYSEAMGVEMKATQDEYSKKVMAQFLKSLK